MTDQKKTSFLGKAKIISPEEIILKTKYSFTINPNDKRQYFENTEGVAFHRINKLKEFMEQELLEIPNVDIDIYMECSRNGRLHFHGTICFNTIDSIKTFYISKINQWLTFSNIEIAELKDPEIWLVYCTKSKHLIDVHITTKDCLDRFRKVKVDKNGVSHKSYFS